MRPIDIAKAAGLGLLILALDLAIAFCVVWAFSLWIEPGHPRSYYVAAAPDISTASTRIAGPLLFALFVWLFSRRRPQRDPFLFAAAVFAAYVALDGATVLFKGFFVPAVLITMALKLAGAVAGAALARRKGAA